MQQPRLQPLHGRRLSSRIGAMEKQKKRIGGFTGAVDPPIRFWNVCLLFSLRRAAVARITSPHPPVAPTIGRRRRVLCLPPTSGESAPAPTPVILSEHPNAREACDVPGIAHRAKRRIFLLSRSVSSDTPIPAHTCRGDLSGRQARNAFLMHSSPQQKHRSCGFSAASVFL